MFEQYKKELDKLLKESQSKDNNWRGWSLIESLEDIISKYKIFNMC